MSARALTAAWLALALGCGGRGAPVGPARATAGEVAVVALPVQKSQSSERFMTREGCVRCHQPLGFFQTVPLETVESYRPADGPMARGFLAMTKARTPEPEQIASAHSEF